MLKIKEYYHFGGEHYLMLDGIKYAARLSLPHLYRELYDRNHVKNILLPLIGTIRHHDYPEIQKYPKDETLQTLQNLFGVALVPARLDERYQIEYKGDRPTVTDNSIESIFVPSMIQNFSHFHAVRDGKLATLLTSARKS